MRSTFTGIEISKRGLFAQQAALQTTSHNIANANTKGYSRQIVNLSAARPIEALGMNRSTIPGQSGMGVDIQSITRIREAFLDKQYYNESKYYGEWTVRRDTIEKIEGIFNEPSDTGIRQVMDNFWNAWQELSKQPDNMETRAVVKESALALADAFNHMSKKLNDLDSDLSDNIAVKVTEVNTTLDQIRNLNLEIARLEGLGNNANDLRDQRDLLTDRLSQLINIQVVEQDDGYHISMGNEPLVQGAQVMQFDQAFVDAAYASGELNSGELYGLIFSKQEIVQKYRDDINVLVSTFADAVNALHAQGYTLQDPATPGGQLFVYNPQDPALTIEVHSDIRDHVANIAASKRTYTDENGIEHVVRGNNELALEMAELRNKMMNFSSGTSGVVLSEGTFDEYFRAVVGELGVQGQEANRQAMNQRVLLEQVEMSRQSVSGVSLDEEMANMIKFQHAYNAAARALTVFDEVLDKVINGMGIVGR